MTFLTLQGVAFYNRAFMKSEALALTPFYRNGGYVLVVRNGRQVIFRQKIISLR
ncbi:MAG: hypothetical protein JW863_11335 [Chitinispirillaceae bacterium]|nr:hypothetical protein [Chitinispirillaceae bacterium]